MWDGLQKSSEWGPLLLKLCWTCLCSLWSSRAMADRSTYSLLLDARYWNQNLTGNKTRGSSFGTSHEKYQWNSQNLFFLPHVFFWWQDDFCRVPWFYYLSCSVTVWVKLQNVAKNKWTPPWGSGVSDTTISNLCWHFRLQWTLPEAPPPLATVAMSVKLSGLAESSQGDWLHSLVKYWIIFGKTKKQFQTEGLRWASEW